MLVSGRMNIGIYNSATALSSLEKWQEVTSQNISAGNVPGYKGNQMSFESIQAGYLGINSAGRTVETPTTMAISSNQFNFGDGQINQSGAKTHMAIDGEGFFKIQGQGFEYYTRDGEFHINGDDELVTKGGDIVLGLGGPIKVNPQLGEITISQTGEVFQGSVPTGKLAIVDTTEKAALIRMTGGFRLGSDSDVTMREIEDPRVVQGSLEESNVNTLKEMVNLISISRAFEVNHKVIQSLDDIQGKTIEVLGNTN